MAVCPCIVERPLNLSFMVRLRGKSRVHIRAAAAEKGTKIGVARILSIRNNTTMRYGCFK
jgi:hypothetical protein